MSQISRFHEIGLMTPETMINSFERELENSGEDLSKKQIAEYRFSLYATKKQGLLNALNMYFGEDMTKNLANRQHYLSSGDYEKSDQFPTAQKLYDLCQKWIEEAQKLGVQNDEIRIIKKRISDWKKYYLDK